jgi:hypothetical protein
LAAQLNSGYKGPTANAARTGAAWTNPANADASDNNTLCTLTTTAAATRIHDW